MKAKILNIDYQENSINALILGSLNGLKREDLIDLKKVRKKRTLNQNDLYWLFCEYVGNNEDLQMTKEQVHSGFLSEHHKILKIGKTGKVFQSIGSTTDFDTKEFGDYFRKCELTAIEYGVDLNPFWLEYDRFKGLNY